MVQQNEFLTLLVALGVLVFVVSNRQGLRDLPRSSLCLAAFLVLVAGLAFTVLEGLVWQDVFNMLEHFCYGASSVLLAVWVWLVSRGASQWHRT
ncbi:MAG: hypothetical protein GXX96_30755 [Planctomycetaceae bacterium]|nr:hypothetical protein [Planctomycetaceae bacterium]